MARFVRDEKKTYPIAWLLIGGLFAASSVWAMYAESVTRVPWQKHQKAFFELELELARQAKQAAEVAWEVRAAEEPLKGQLARLAELKTERESGAYATDKERAAQLKRDFEAAELKKTFGASDLDEAYYYRNLAEYERDDAQVAVRKALKLAYPEDLAKARADADALYEDPMPTAPAAGVTPKIAHLQAEIERMSAHVSALEKTLQTNHSPDLAEALQTSLTKERAVVARLETEVKHQKRIDTALVNMNAIMGPDEPRVTEQDPVKLQAANDKARADVCKGKEGTRNCLKWLKLAPVDREFKALSIAVGKVKRPLEDATNRYNKAVKRAEPKVDLDSLILSLIGPYQIQQVVTHWIDFERDVDIEQVDRCQTCHMGVDIGHYTAADIAEPYRTHPRRDLLLKTHAVDKFGCTACHQGQGRATDDLAHSGWELEKKHGKERWHFAGDYYWEDPILPVGKLSKIIIDEQNDELEVKLGKGKKGKIQLEHGVRATEDEFYGELQSKLQELLDKNEKLAKTWRAVARKRDNRVSLGLERLASAEAEAKKGKLPKVIVKFTKIKVAQLLGFGRTQQLKSKTETLYTAQRPPVQPIRAESMTAQGSLVDTANDYRYEPPRGSAGLQVVDDMRNRFIQGLPEIESGCLRCHIQSADLVPPRSAASYVTAKLAYEKSEAQRAKDPAAYQKAHGGDHLPPVRQSPREVSSLAPTLDDGRAVFRQLNCTGCHLVEGMENNTDAGPQLNDLSSKVEPEWLLTWLRDPRGWRGKTSMPNLWPRPLDPASKLPYPEGSPEYAKWDKERREETIAISAYLYDRSENPKAGGAAQPLRGKVAGYANVDGASQEEGKQLFESYGCQGCHSTVDSGSSLPAAWRERERDVAPTLSNLGAKTSADWIAYWVEDPSRYWHGTSMPNMRLTRREAASIGKYLASLTSKPLASAKVSTDEVKLVADAKARNAEMACSVAGGRNMSWVDCGAKVIAHRGCYGCHQIDGFEKASPIGPELTGFAKKDVSTLDFGYAISDHHLQTTETFATLKIDSPRVYTRDRIKLRMGDFDTSAEEIRALVVFLKGLVTAKPAREFDPMQSPGHASVIEGRQLVNDLNCRACHVLEGRGGDIDGWRSATLIKDPQRRAPWLDGQGARVQPEWLFKFLRDPQKHGIRPWLHPEWVWGDEVPADKRALRMPSFNLTAEQWTAIVQYFAAWDEQPYPYQYPEVRELSQKQKLFSLTHMNSPEAGNCLSCHYHGDFPVERAKGDIYKMAPNFALVRERLRPAWVQQWLLRPQNFLPYTKMTAFWATVDRDKKATHWPKESDPFISPAPKGWDKVPGFDGLSGPEQVDLVRDFLFSLDPNTNFPKVGEETDSPLIAPDGGKLEAKEAAGTDQKPRRTGALRRRSHM